MRLGQACGTQPAIPEAPGGALADQAGPLQHLDMLGSASERHGERLGQLSDAALAKRQVPDHGTPRRIGQRMEDGVEAGRFMLNHVVDYKRRSGR